MLFARLVMILFQSTPSVGRATFNFSPNHSLSSFQSTPSVGRATRGQRQTTKRHSDFNPRPPWGGRRMPTKNMDSRSIFQSTPSVGRATVGEIYGPNIPVKISIHALRGEGDQERSQCQIRDNEHFNPRPPWGGRHDIRPQALVEYNISIHALRGEGDCNVRKTVLGVVGISIHALRGEGDDTCRGLNKQQRISIHALRGEGDVVTDLTVLYRSLFQSTPSVGRATREAREMAGLTQFQSTPSVGRAT